MKKIKIRLLGILLSAIMAAGLLTPQVVSFADEEEGYWLGEQGDEEGDDWSDTPPDYKLVPSNSDINFGNITQNSSDVPFVELIVTNVGSDAVEWYYFKSDPNEIFKVDLPDTNSLAPGECMAIYITMRSDRPIGTYNGYIYFAPVYEESSYNTAYIDLHGNIISGSPTVTSISVSPRTATMSAGSTSDFYATVKGENNPDTRVTWKMYGNTDPGSNINSNGRVYIGDNENANSIQISATSVQDTSFVATADIVIEKGRYTVSTASNPTNGGSTGGGGTVVRGSSVSLLACPNNGFTFKNWTLDGNEVSKSSRYDISNVTKNMNLVANFTQTSCYIKTKSNYEKAGSITASKSVAYGGSLRLDASVNSGYSFDGWYENNKLLSNQTSYTLNNITCDHEIYANFTQEIFTVKTQASPSNGGVVNGGGNYKRNADVSLTATPVEGYEFVNWVCNNSDLSHDKSITLKGIKQDYDITANFQKKNVQTYTLQSTVAGGHGSIWPTGNTTVAQGSSVTYTFAPDNGYVVSAVAVDGKQVGAVANYTFNNIMGNHTIAVAYAKLAVASPTAAPSKAPSQTAAPSPSAAPTPEIPKEEPQEEIEEATLVDVDGDGVAETPLDEITEDVQVLPEIDMGAQTGVLQKYNITPTQAMESIENGTDAVLLRAAAEERYLQVSVHNDFADMASETEDLDYENIVSVPNMGNVVNSMLSSEEKLSVLQGHNIGINLNIFNNGINTINDDDKEIAQAAFKDNVNIGRYFEVALIKTTEENSDVVTETSEPVTIVMNIPKGLRDSTRKFCIIRAHRENDGTLRISYLQDEDDNPDTITFNTNKFSSYAIGYIGGEKIGTRTSMIIIGIIILLVIAIIVTVVMGIGASHAKKRRAKARAAAARRKM